VSSAASLGVPARVIGVLGGTDLVVDTSLRVPVDDLVEAYTDAIPALMDR